MLIAAASLLFAGSVTGFCSVSMRPYDLAPSLRYDALKLQTRLAMIAFTLHATGTLLLASGLVGGGL